MPAPLMLSRPIPSTGEAMPVIGLGTWPVFDVGADENARRRTPRGVAAAARCRRQNDRHFADVWPGRRVSPAISSPIWLRGRAPFSRPRYGQRAASRHRPDARSAESAAQRSHRPDPDPQPARLAHPSRDTAADEGGVAISAISASRITRTAPCPNWRTFSTPSPASISSNAAIRWPARRPRAICSRSRLRAGWRSSSISRSGQGGLFRRCAAGPCRNGLGSSIAKAGRSCSSNTSVAEPAVTCVIPGDPQPRAHGRQSPGRLRPPARREQRRQIRALWDGL